MPNKKHETDGVPERLRQITIETLPIEIPYVLDIEPFVEPQEVMYVDKTQDRVCGCKMIKEGCSRGLWRIADGIMDDLTLSMERKKLILRTKKKRGKSLIVDKSSDNCGGC